MVPVKLFKNQPEGRPSALDELDRTTRHCTPTPDVKVHGDPARVDVQLIPNAGTNSSPEQNDLIAMATLPSGSMKLTCFTMSELPKSD